jgi:hypothetical protein
MAKRKRIQEGKLSALIIQEISKNTEKKYARSKDMHGEVVKDIMKENDCSWTEAKQVYKFRQVSQGIKKDIDLLICSHS